MCLFLVNNTLLCIKKFFFYTRITLYPSSILLLPHPVHTLPHPDARVTLTPNTGRGSGCAKGSIGFARGRTLPVSGVRSVPFPHQAHFALGLPAGIPFSRNYPPTTLFQRVGCAYPSAHNREGTSESGALLVAGLPVCHSSTDWTDGLGWYDRVEFYSGIALFIFKG